MKLITNAGVRQKDIGNEKKTREMVSLITSIK
jgi:hypothetical protein